MEGTSTVFSSKFVEARCGHGSAEVRSAVAGALALTVAMPSVAEAPTRHRGTGIARREAFHERQRAERAELEYSTSNTLGGSGGYYSVPEIDITPACVAGLAVGVTRAFVCRSRLALLR